MTVTRHTLTGTVVDHDGNPFPSYTVEAYVQTNLAPGVALVDTAGHRIQLGTLELDLDPTTGAFSIDLVATTSGSVTPTGVQYQVVVAYPDIAGNSRHSWASGWFDLTADTTLDAVAVTSFVPANFQSDFLTVAQALLDAQITLSGIDDSDSEVAGLVSNGSLGPLTRAALSASMGVQIATDGTAAAVAADNRFFNKAGPLTDKQAPKQARPFMPVDLSAMLTPSVSPYPRSDGLVAATGFDRYWLMIGEDWQMHVVCKQDFSTYRAERAADWSSDTPFYVSASSKVVGYDATVESNNTFFGGLAKESWTYTDPETNGTSTTGYVIAVGTGDQTAPASGIYNPPAVMFWREGIASGVTSAAQSLTKMLSTAGIMGGVTSSPRCLQGASRTAVDTFFLYGSGNNQSTNPADSRATFGKMVLTLNSSKTRTGATSVSSLTWTDYLSVLQATVTASFASETIVNVPWCADQLVGGVLYVLVTTKQSTTYRTRMLKFTPGANTAALDTLPAIDADALTTTAFYPMTPVASVTNQNCRGAVGANGILFTVQGVGGATYAYYKPNASSFWRNVNNQVVRALGENGPAVNGVAWDAHKSRFVVCGGFQQYGEAGWLDADCKQGQPLTATLPAPLRFNDATRSAIGIYADADGVLVVGARQLALYIPEGCIEPPPTRVLWGLHVAPTGSNDEITISAGEALIYVASSGPPRRVYSAGGTIFGLTNLDNTFTIVLTLAGAVSRPGSGWVSGADWDEVAQVYQCVLAVIDRTANSVPITVAEIDQNLRREAVGRP